MKILKFGGTSLGHVDRIREVANFRDKECPHILLEASGNITAENIENYLNSGVNAISSGSIIHQAVWLDFSMKFD